MSGHAYPIGKFDRVVVTRDVLGADGRLVVQAGAIGTIRANNQGLVGVLFDESPAYVELSGCKRRSQYVPFISTKTIEYCP